MMKMTSIVAFVLEGVCLHRLDQLQLLSGCVIDLEYCVVEWFALERNQDHCVIYDIAPKYCILDSLVGYKGYSNSSKRFLPTVIEIMVI